jgi:menaquinone-dependent protoporphyrinogen oxidase
MTVLVAVATKYGATADIAKAVAQTLESHAIQVTLADPEDISDVDEFDAVILGSAVYGGQWMSSAVMLLNRCREELRSRPVWLFSSGPLGDPLRPEGEPSVVPGFVANVRARGHQVFAGKLDKSRLGFAERAVVTALRAPEGDFRDWVAIEAWAEEVAAALAAEPTGERPSAA